MATKFWIVWRDNSQANFKKHFTVQSAMDETIRLANINPNADFYVLEALRVYRGNVLVSTYPCDEEAV
jgi:hypothetical protein